MTTDILAAARLVRWFLHPLSAEADRVRVRLAELGFPSVRSRVDAMRADKVTLLLMACDLRTAAHDLNAAEATRAREIADELGALARSPAWLAMPSEAEVLALA